MLRFAAKRGIVDQIVDNSGDAVENRRGEEVPLYRILILAVALGATSVAFAQAYPAKAVRIVNPFAPGGATDIIARQHGQKLTEASGQPVVVENRAGASGALGVEHVAKSPPDGYTLLIATRPRTLAINTSLYAKLPYDAAKDFAPLTLAGSTPRAHGAARPRRSRRQRADRHAKKNPGKLAYASGGNGTSHHLTMELLKSMTGTLHRSTSRTRAPGRR